MTPKPRRMRGNDVHKAKTDREIRRTLKRYLARRIYRHRNQASAAQQKG